MVQRRTFLKLGLAGSALLVAGGTASWLAGRDSVANRREVLAGVVPAILDGALPSDPAQRTLAVGQASAAVETAITALSPAAQDELAQLFALMAIAPTRLLLTGLTASWREAGVAEVASVLQAWRTHRLELLQSAYHALHDLVTGSWYAEPSHWAAIGYDGPPRL